MKLFKKNNEGFFICEECGIICKYKTNFHRHINLNHENIKIYYNKWLKDNTDVCKICGSETEFTNIKYKNCCSKICTNQYNILRTKEEVLKKFGVENIFML